MRTGRLCFTTTVLLLGLAAPASASGPSCLHDRITARPDRDRAIELDCNGVTDAAVVSAPAHGTVSDLRVEAGQVRWTHGTPAGAPPEDAMELELGDGTNSVRHAVAIEVIPLSQNTAPVCDPVQLAERGPGDAPIEVSFFVRCTDAEHDRMTMEGHGPGTFTFAPPVLAGGTPRVAPSWMYRTATSRGDERATLAATDELGARSADAPIDIRVDPELDTPPACFGSRYGTPDGALVKEVYSRPGKARSFELYCTDYELDPMEMRVSVPPARGDVTLTPSGDHNSGLDRTMSWRATYTPRGSFTGVDEFAVTTNQVGGATNRGRVRIEMREPPANEQPTCSGGGSFPWAEGALASSVRIPVTVTDNLLYNHVAYCEDPDGDPLAFAITDPPTFGSVDTELAAGVEGEILRIIHRNPARGVGRVLFSFTVADGVGETVTYRGALEWLPPEPWWYIPPPAPAAAAAAGGGGTQGAVSPAAQARAALRSSAVRLVRRLGAARVYARSGRQRVAKTAAPLAVVCPAACSVRGRVQPFAGKRRAGRQSLVKRTGRAGEAVLIQRRLSARERRTLRRAGGGVVETRLSVSLAGAKALRGTVRVGMRR